MRSDDKERMKFTPYPIETNITINTHTHTAHRTEFDKSVSVLCFVPWIAFANSKMKTSSSVCVRCARRGFFFHRFNRCDWSARNATHRRTCSSRCKRRTVCAQLGLFLRFWFYFYLFVRCFHHFKHKYVHLIHTRCTGWMHECAYGICGIHEFAIFMLPHNTYL